MSLFIGPATVLAAVDDAVPSQQKPPELSAALVSCLKGALGEAAFQDIQTGERSPTDDEFDKGEACFDQFGAPIHEPGQAKEKPKPQDLKFAPGTEQCLKEKLGDSFREQMAAVDNPQASKALRKQTKDCFGKNVPGNQPQELPAEVKSCLVTAVGQAEAEQMLKGNPPEPGSELFNKVKDAKCFKQLGPPPGHDRPNISAESKACVEKVMGRSFDEPGDEPTEDQKQQIGRECFGGRGPDGQGPPPMPEAVRSCLESAFGDQLDDLKKGPEFLTEEQKQKADSCFREHDFHPGGPEGNRGPGGPELSDEKRECVENIMGGKLDGPREPTEEQKIRIGRECFNVGTGGPGEPNGGPGPAGAGLDPEKQACVERIMGRPEPGKQPTEEQRQQVGRECFGNSGPGPNSGPGGSNDPNGQPGQPPKNECVERITGGNSPTDEQQRQINRECFGAAGEPNRGPGGPGDQPPKQPGSPPPNQGNSGPSGNSGSGSVREPDKNCVERILGRRPDPVNLPTPEQQAQIDRECPAR